LNNSISLITGEASGSPFKLENISNVSVFSNEEPLNIYARQP
jgi:hypothetical protein